jgi:hypothetical protein
MALFLAQRRERDAGGDLSAGAGCLERLEQGTGGIAHPEGTAFG